MARPWVLSTQHLVGLGAAAAAGTAALSAGAAGGFGVVLAGAAYVGGMLIVPHRKVESLGAASAPAAVPVGDLEASLDELMRTAHRAGRRLPRDVRATLTHIVGGLREILDHPAALAESIDSSHEVERIITDYLPATVDQYLAVDPTYARTSRGESGRTAYQEVLWQLDVYRERVSRIAEQVHETSARSLDDHGRFLRDRYHESTLTQESQDPGGSKQQARPAPRDPRRPR